MFSDSQYVVQALSVLECIPVINTANILVAQLFGLIQSSSHSRSAPCFVGHIRSHSNLPGALTHGNAIANRATHIGLSAVSQAQQSHALLHQAAQVLRYQYGITRQQAREIVKNCPSCEPLLPVTHFGVHT